MKTIAVLTSGGDSPGMNAAVRAVVRTACENGIRVLGVVRGYNGLINGDFVEMDLRSVSDIIHRGGTKLYSARSVEFATEEGMRKAIRVCRENGIEGVAGFLLSEVDISGQIEIPGILWVGVEQRLQRFACLVMAR